MRAQKRITVERNIKQDIDTNKFYVTFCYGKDGAGNAKHKTKTFDDLSEAQIALQPHELNMLKGDATEPNRLDLNNAIQRHLETPSLKSEASTLYGYQVIARQCGKKYLFAFGKFCAIIQIK